MRELSKTVIRRLKGYMGSINNYFSSSGFLVHPCLIDGQQSLVYEKDLKQKDPGAYRYITNYARINKFSLKEDQRNSFERVQQERRKNFMPMMALGAGMLFSKTVIASPIHDLFTNSTEMTTQLGSESLEENKQDKLVKNLLDWVGSNSSFDISSDELPNVMRVSSDDMLQVAFKSQFPQAVDANKLQIYGLYNFRDKTVYILDSLDLESENGKGILLHELVHYLQYQYGDDKQVDCKNELERLAYLLEADYLHDHGHKAGFNDAHVKSVSKCS